MSLAVYLPLALPALFAPFAGPLAARLDPVHATWLLTLFVWMVSFWWWEFRFHELDIKWTFDDGGTATGKNVSYTFAENFLGGVPHTGQVVVTDPTGLKTTLPFLVPVADARLSLSCATPSVRN